MRNDSSPRPMQHLAALGRLYPGAWKQIERFRADRGRGLPDWPAWCYCPLAGAYAVVSGGGDNRVPVDHAHHVGQVAALAAWRATKGIYRYDPELLDALWNTPVTGDLPAEVLHRLPEWCVYLELGGRESLLGPLAGAYAHLEHDAGDGRQELRLVLDAGGALLPVPIHLAGGLEAGLEAAHGEAVWQWTAAGPRTGDQVRGFQEQLGAARPAIREAIEPIVSLVLYLCSEEPELADRAGQRRRPGPPPPLPSGRRPAAQAPTTWDVGLRIGATLRRARDAEASEPTGGTHASPRSHMRRAHWHTYWTGPGRTDPVLRWLSPILVGAQEDLVPTVRPVES